MRYFLEQCNQGAERVTQTVRINGTYGGMPKGFKYAGSGSPIWISTGLYAAAGEIITVTVGEDVLTKPKPDKFYFFDVQIGCHKDNLYNKLDLKRPPQNCDSDAD